MESIKVLVSHNFSTALIERMRAVSPRLEIVQQVARSREELQPHLEGVEVLYSSAAFPYPEDAPDLQWLQCHLAGIDQLLEHPLMTQSKVMISTTNGVHAVNMAEYCLAMMLAFGHRLPTMLEDQGGIYWPPKGKWERYVPRELRGATLAIVGYGAIGRELARMASAMGMRVLAVKRNLRDLNDTSYRFEGLGDPDGSIPDRFYPPEALHSALAEADYVALTLPLTYDTQHLIDAQAIQVMKPGAVLINVARGPVLEEAALLQALGSGRLSGAALDVFDVEPLPEDNPLWKAKNLIISPHVAGFTPHYDERAAEIFCANLVRYLQDEPLINVVNRSLGY